MTVENFLPKGKGLIKLGRNWSVISITAIDNDKVVPFVVTNGELKKLHTNYTLSDRRFKQINRQVQAVYAKYETMAKLAQELKKPNWTFDLEKYGVIIMKNGQLKISRWITKKDNQYERIWQTLQDINSAIRQQDHTIDGCLEKKNGMKNEDEFSPELLNLLIKLKVILPYIEMRRELLIHAQNQMDTSIRQAVKGIELFLEAKGSDQKKCLGLPERLKRLTFFLNNKWPKPYQEKIDQLIPLIKEAKRYATNLQWEKTEFLLTNVKNKLSSTIETFSRQSPLTNISEIGPIQILAEVDKHGLTYEVMAIAKKYLPEQYLKYRGFFRLKVLLAVAQLMITGKLINQEEILKLCR